jgi:hypothetical protein
MTATALAEKCNVVLDGTGDGGYDTLAAKVQKMKDAGHRVEAHYVTVDTETAVERALERGRLTGRYIPETYLREVHANVSRILPKAMASGMFDECTLWDTNGKAPVKAASCIGSKLIIHDQKAWDRFIAKGEPQRGDRNDGPDSQRGNAGKETKQEGHHRDGDLSEEDHTRDQEFPQGRDCRRSFRDPCLISELYETDVSRELRDAQGQWTTGGSEEPSVILGTNMLGEREVKEYLKKNNAREWKAAPLRKGVQKGPYRQCYENATQVVLSDKELDFVEGYGYTPKTPKGMVFLHAWAVDKDGNVVDPTWDNPEKCTYFGVKYDRAKYLKHIYKTKYYGVLGGTDKSARKVIERGSL